MESVVNKKFPSEKARQQYIKQQELSELQMAQQNDDKISAGLKDLEYDVIPAIEDTRSLAEREHDTQLQQQTAYKNALQLMDGDSHEANVLLSKITQPNYITFNRYYLEIFEGLKNQIGKLHPTEAFQFIQ